MNPGEFSRKAQKSVEDIEFRRNPDDSIEIRRNPWKLWNSKEIQMRIPQKSKACNRIQKKSVETAFKKIAWKSREVKTIHRNQWKLQNSIEFHRIPWKSKEFKTNSQNSMETIE